MEVAGSSGWGDEASSGEISQGHLARHVIEGAELRDRAAPDSDHHSFSRPGSPHSRS